MSTLHASYAGPGLQVADALIRAGGQEGWTFVPHKSPHGTVVLEKGFTIWAWGSSLVILFEEVHPTLTRLTVHTGQTAALYDWGHAKRCARRLLDAVGAERA